MKKIIFSMLVMMFAIPSMGQDLAVQGGLGVQNGIFNINLDLDIQKQSSHAFGGYLVYGQGKNPGNGDFSRGSFWSVGGDFKVFFGPDDWKVYFAPGLGIISFETPSGSDSTTTLGTLFKAGALVNLTPDVAIGLEQMYLQNWFSPKYYGGTYLLTSAAIRISL